MDLSGEYGTLAIGHEGESSVTTCCSLIRLMALPEEGVVISIQANTAATDHPYDTYNSQVVRLTQVLRGCGSGMSPDAVSAREGPTQLPAALMLQCLVLSPAAEAPTNGLTAASRWRMRRLIVASGTKGMKVTVWVWDEIKTIGQYFVALLDDLGYRANLKLHRISPHFRGFLTRDSRAQIGFVGWFADYPAPSGFIESTLTCDSFVPNDRFQANYSQFWDPEIDSLIAEAKDLQVSDPAAARRLWARIDAATSSRFSITDGLKSCRLESATISTTRCGGFPSITCGSDSPTV
jgi:hypothetical protein